MLRDKRVNPVKNKEKIPEGIFSQAAFFKDENPSEEIVSKVVPKYMRDMDANQKNKKLLYGLYQLDWMSGKGYTIDDLISSMIGFSFDQGKYETNTHVGMCYCLDDMLTDWEKDQGFEGNIWEKGFIWKSFEEFIGAEFLIHEYIEKLINKLTETEKREKLREWYQKYTQNERVNNPTA
jgi:hypothetical protein